MIDQSLKVFRRCTVLIEHINKIIGKMALTNMMNATHDVIAIEMLLQPMS